MVVERELVRVNESLEIPEGELAFRYSRSSGPGGQNVNKVATKVTLLFAVGGSTVLTAEQKALVGERLANRIAKDGVLHLSSERHRTRSANQRDAVERFAALIAAALAPRKRRRATRVPEASKRRRLEAKRQRSKRKRQRARPPSDD
jgi:ribosome-associated protein